jgi:hypothetical protein
MWLCSHALCSQWHPSSSTEKELNILTIGLVFLLGSFLALLYVESPCGASLWSIVTPNQIGCVATNPSESYFCCDPIHVRAKSSWIFWAYKCSFHEVLFCSLMNRFSLVVLMTTLGYLVIDDISLPPTRFWTTSHGMVYVIPLLWVSISSWFCSQNQVLLSDHPRHKSSCQSHKHIFQSW